MRAVIQRVKRASVSIAESEKSSIGKGFLVLLGVSENDTPDEAEIIAKKISGLRIMEDENGKMNLSLADVGGEILIVSQFTLYGDCSHGNRPSFITAARPETAVPLYERTIELLEQKTGKKPKTGEFGADMQVELVNDGPVTIIIDTDNI